MPTIIYDIYGPGLYIEAPLGDTEFSSKARMALNIIRSTTVGADLIKEINKVCKGQSRTFGFGRTNKRRVVIEKSENATAVPTQDTCDAFRALLNQPGNGLLADPAFEKTVRGQGGCKGAIARWNPSNTIPVTIIQRPSFLSLAHELIQCLHFISGDCTRAPTRQFDLTIDSGLAEEEARTVGIGAYDYPDHSDVFCENAIRNAFNQPKRTEYAPGITFANAVRTT